eukprot:GFYU01013865.1.p1 GENE.GFYU01013865.1~~GFYU01013865.1.p1  ORF type:complete len:393 (-),score=88.64 GFYU01013865.1:354-1532(-)
MGCGQSARPVKTSAEGVDAPTAAATVADAPTDQATAAQELPDKALPFSKFFDDILESEPNPPRLSELLRDTRSARERLYGKLSHRTGTAFVKIVAARDIPRRDVGSESDVYVQFRTALIKPVVSAGTLGTEAHIQSDNQNPQFEDAAYELPIGPEGAPLMWSGAVKGPTDGEALGATGGTSALRMEVMDKDCMSADDVIGVIDWTWQDITTVGQSSAGPQWYRITARQPGAEEADLGELCVELTWRDISEDPWLTDLSVARSDEERRTYYPGAICFGKASPEDLDNVRQVWEEIAKTVRTGDVILWASQDANEIDAALHRGINALTNSIYTHAAMAYVVEGLPPMTVEVSGAFDWETDFIAQRYGLHEGTFTTTTSGEYTGFPVAATIGKAT